MSSVPEEIYQEILQRATVKSLLVCKCVCKNWYALISSPDFVKLHTAQKNNPVLMLEVDYREVKSIGYDSLATSLGEIEQDAVIEMKYPFKTFSLHYSVRLVGSCNGLVCLQFFEHDVGGRHYFCLWNPATKEYKEIPKVPELSDQNRIRDTSQRIYCFCALGYDHRTADYKFAVGETLRDDITTLVHIYSLVSNSWKPGHTVPYRFPNSLHRYGVLVNGDLHWLAKTPQRKDLLLSLDISDESFKELLLPRELLEKKKNPDMILGVLQGCLCILADAYVDGIIRLDVWKMLDYGVQESWNRRYIITHENIIREPNRRLIPIRSFVNGKILFIAYCNLVLYDPEHGSAIKLNIRDTFGSAITMLGVNYFESLVSLNSGTYVG